MADSAVAIDGLKPFEIALHFAPKVTFDRDLQRIDRVDDGVQLFRRQFFGTRIRVDISDLQHSLRIIWTDSVNVGQRGLDPLVTRNFYSEKTGHDI